MMGKGAILMVLGFSFLFLVIGNNMLSYSTRSVENMTGYYEDQVAHYIAVSGANMAANQLFLDKTWETGYQNVSMSGGTLNVYISNHINSSSKVIICHEPPGNPGARHTLSINSSALSAHLAHGCSVGACGGEAVDDQLATIVSEGTYRGITKAVVVELRPSYFSKFGNYYSYISAYPATGDTFSGPFHSNDHLQVSGSPVFRGKTTCRKQVKGGSPIFLGGFQNGVDMPLEFDTTGMRVSAESAGHVFRDTTGTNQRIDVKIYFDSTGSVTTSFRIADGLGIWSTPETKPIDSLASNGLIFVEKGNIITKGTVNGKVTIVASGGGASSTGSVYISDDIVYHDSPLTNPNSDDILGIVAEDKIRIEANSDTYGRDINTQASMFALNGDIGPDDNLVDQYFLGQWNILGGLIAKTTRVTAQYNWWGNPVRGLKFVHTYDERFMTYVPPHFPHTKHFEIVSWYE